MGRFSKKKKVTEHKMCFGFLKKFIILRITERDTMKDAYGLRVKYMLFLLDFNLIFKFCRWIFKKFSNIKFHENLPSGSRAVPCGRTDKYDEANIRLS
jgi:hypothetical protein